MIDLATALAEYEAWMREHLPVVDEGGVAEKATAIADSAFAFLRGNFPWWLVRWREHERDFADAPAVVAVGDLHVENFGTWRDAEGRLIWGINDFDEAYPMPVAHDLVRLAVSARLAIEEERLFYDPDEAVKDILRGYRAALARGGRHFVLETDDLDWLRRLAKRQLRSNSGFWRRSERWLPSGREDKTAIALLRAQLEQRDGAELLRVASRRAGIGSLGRPRVVALASWRGGLIAREAKALLPSAVCWLRREKGDPLALIRRIEANAIRSHDPCRVLTPKWLVRRLSPESDKIDLRKSLGDDDASRLLEAMGQEVANVHLGTAHEPEAIIAWLDRRPKKWLVEISEVLGDAITDDWRDYVRALKPAKLRNAG